MDAKRMSTAETCVHAAHNSRLSFPEIVGKLIDAGFEGYMVDYRPNSQSHYLPVGDNLTMDMRPSAGGVAEARDATEIERLVRWAQANPADYSYVAFSEKVKDAGCAGYLVSFLGRRVVYFRAHRRDPCRTLPEVTGYVREVLRISDRQGHSHHLCRTRIGERFSA